MRKSAWAIFLIWSDVAIQIIYRVLYIGLGVVLLTIGTGFVVEFFSTTFGAWKDRNLQRKAVS